MCRESTAVLVCTPTPLPTRWGLAWLMGICAVTCAAACGSVQVGKLKVYRLVLHHRRLHYASGADFCFVVSMTVTIGSRTV